MNKQALQEIINNKQSLTYSKLCDKLEIEKKTSNSKTKQLEDLSKIVFFEKFGTKFHIYRWRTEEELEEYRINGDYEELLELALYTFLQQQESNTYEIKMHEIMEATGLVNKNYYVGKYNISEVFNLMDKGTIYPINGESERQMVANIDSFFNNTSRNLDRKCKELLKKMEELLLIQYTPIYYYIITCYDKNNKPYRKSVNFSNDDIEDYMRIKRDILKEYSNQTDLDSDLIIKMLTPSQRMDFLRRSRNKLLEEKKWLNFAKKYEIITNRAYIQEYTTNKINKLKENINNKVLAGVNNKYPSYSYWFIDINRNDNIKKEIYRNIGQKFS